MESGKNSGFDIDLGNKCSKNAFSWAKKTFNNRLGKMGFPCFNVDGAFSNMIDFNGLKIGISSDGIGTKVEIAERVQIYDTLGYDLIAMVVDDLIAGGFEPTNLSNIIDVDHLDYEIIDHLMEGLHDAAEFSHIAVTGGEIAELGNRIGGYGHKMHFNWCATGIGVLHKNLTEPIDGTKIKVGNVIISLKSRGFRSNGFSVVRNVMKATFGEEWHNVMYSNTKSWGEALLTSSLIYSPAICKVFDAGLKINGISHITGGGVVDNLGRTLKVNHLGAKLDNLFEPLDFMKKVQILGKISDEKAYLYWNMGNGMLIVVDENYAEKIVNIIKNEGYETKIAGEVVSEQIITINNKKWKVD